MDPDTPSPKAIQDTSQESSQASSSSAGGPTRERIEEAIRDEIERRTRSPKQINAGQCEGFALAVKNRLYDPEELTVTGAEIDGACTLGRWGGHVWLHASHLGGERGLHFDAEAPEGVMDWQQMPFYRRKKENPALPLGPVSDEIMEDPTRVDRLDTLRWIERFSGACCVYGYGPDGSERFGSSSGWSVKNPDATYTPTVWYRGALPLRALKDCQTGRCPEREDWREWLEEENESRTRREGFQTYHSWFEGGIREPVIVDGQGPLIWDGWHRTAWAIDQGKSTIPAFLGVRPGPEPAAENLQGG